MRFTRSSSNYTVGWPALAIPMHSTPRSTWRSRVSAGRMCTATSSRWPRRTFSTSALIIRMLTVTSAPQPKLRMSFLFMNGYELSASEDEYESLLLLVAEHKLSKSQIADFLRLHSASR